MYILVKPQLGKYYLPIDSRLDIKVETPDGLSGHMYYIFPITISTFIFIITVCTRTRYHILTPKFDKK